jgi:excisionase family DNA binding protein
MEELTTSQAAERLNAGVSTVRLWCQQGRFPNARAEATPRGSVWFIPIRDLKGFVKPRRGRTPARRRKAPVKAARSGKG